MTERETAASRALEELGITFVKHDSSAIGICYTMSSEHPEVSTRLLGRMFETIEAVEDWTALERQRCTIAAGLGVPLWQRGPIAMQGKPVRTTPYVGQMVHYVSYGTPRGEYQSSCRAAVVTEATSFRPPSTGIRTVHAGLCVLNPEGQFFKQGLPMDPGTYHGEHQSIVGAPLPLITCDDLDFTPGSWHFIAEAP